jgi:hypothetical protein
VRCFSEGGILPDLRVLATANYNICTTKQDIVTHLQSDDLQNANYPITKFHPVDIAVKLCTIQPALASTNNSTS